MTVNEGLAALALLFASPLCAQDLERGRALYEMHCGKCHYERLHDRARSKVHDIDDLRDYVLRWSRETRHGFTLDEIEDVVQHLNETHYRFKPRARPAAVRFHLGMAVAVASRVGRGHEGDPEAGGHPDLRGCGHGVARREMRVRVACLADDQHAAELVL